MDAKAAREFLASAGATEVGRTAMQELGYGAIIGKERNGDDTSTVTIARRVKQRLHQQYPTVF